MRKTGSLRKTGSHQEIAPNDLRTNRHAALRTVLLPLVRGYLECAPKSGFAKRSAVACDIYCSSSSGWSRIASASNRNRDSLSSLFSSPRSSSRWPFTEETSFTVERSFTIYDERDCCIANLEKKRCDPVQCLLEPLYNR